MKIELFKTVVLENKYRGGLALLLFVCLISFTLTPGSAQLLNQKRITGLTLGDAAEGSRVTFFSDSALNDYEAFRRGDRFYVKIPLAEFTSVPPHCCANGFEDVQVQRVGNSLVVSFRLQPGATARVDQHSNRLDVIFSAPNRTFHTNTSILGSNRLGLATNAQRTAQNRGSDAAGPMPPGAVPASRQRVVADSGRTGNERALQNWRVPSDLHSNLNKGGNNQSSGRNKQSSAAGNQTKQNNQTSLNGQSANSNETVNGNSQPITATNQSKTSDSAINLPSPLPSPSAGLTPSGPAGYPGLTSATPTASGNSETPISAPISSASPSFLNWKSRSKAALQWASANRLASLLGALILLSLILYLASIFRRRQRMKSARRLKLPKIQPKIQPNDSSDFDELVNAGPSKSRVSSNLPGEFAKKPTMTPAAAVTTPQNHSWMLTKPSVVSPSASREHGDEEEREVFEL